ncbi:MAG: M20/M25/M40 family metallo-hydrolase, partial [Chloroflexi bacterium]|nr:M20/M25/M40 family metallo-hydrolase [Chloroflexota bacterium]
GWSSDPWQCKRQGNLMFGLGAGDMKSGVAATMLATRALAERRELWQGTIVFTSVVDEEAYSVGARALAHANINADVCLCAESDWEHPMLGGMGKVLVRADVHGKAAHGSWPHEGVNAASEAAKFVAQLETLPLGKHPRLHSSQCVLSLQSGSDQYVLTVPEHARATINRHIVPGESGESVLAQMRSLAEHLASPAQFTFAIDPPYYPPWEVEREHPFVKTFGRAYEVEAGHAPQFGYEGFGDANLFAGEMGIPTIHFGPHAGKFHQADEWVDVNSIAATVRVFLRVAVETLQAHVH